MKAMVATHYGPPDVLQLTEVEIPAPRDDEVLMTRRQTLLDAPATNAQWTNLGLLAACLLAMAGRAGHFYHGNQA